jgi:hypothetical protein
MTGGATTTWRLVSLSPLPLWALVGLRHLAQVRVKNRVAVLIDRSASMGFPTRPEGPTRASAAAEALQRFAPGLEGLKDSFNLEVLGFSPELGPVPAEALGAPGSGNRTDLMAALRSLKATDTGGSRKLARPSSSPTAPTTPSCRAVSPRLTEGSGARVSGGTVRVGEPRWSTWRWKTSRSTTSPSSNAVTVDLELRPRARAATSRSFSSGRE